MVINIDQSIFPDLSVATWLIEMHDLVQTTLSENILGDLSLDPYLIWTHLQSFTLSWFKSATFI